MSPPSDRMVPLWVWPIGVAIAAVCYEFNKGGHWQVSTLAAIGACRFVVGSQIERTAGEGPQARQTEETIKWLISIGVAIVGMFVYGLLSGRIKLGEEG